MERNSYKTVGNIRIHTEIEDSISPSIESVESPIRTHKILEMIELPTEETLHQKSLASPQTAASSLPISRQTFYSKLKDTVLNTRLAEKQKFLNEKAETVGLETENIDET